MPLTALRPTLLGALTPALALLLGLAPLGAEALGLGRVQILSTLGKPLDASIPVLLDGGERIGDGCLRAEVVAGDARVPAGLLQLRVDGEPGQRRIRLQSMVRIEEPALRITLALGCPSRLTREFNAVVDPSTGSAPTPAAPPPRPLPQFQPAQVATAEPPPRVRLEVQPAPPRPRARAHVRPRASGPRLVLERPEVLAGPAPAPQATPASAPEMELTPELEAQISQLEQTVAELRAELEARRAAPAPLPPPPASAPPPARPAAIAAPAAHVPAYRDPLTWLMTLALSLLAGSAAYHVSRWLDRRARRESAYWRSLQAAAEGAAAPAPQPPVQATGMAPPVDTSTAAPLPDEGQHAATRPQPRPMAWPPPPVLPFAAAPPTSTEAAMLATQPMPVQAAAAALPTPGPAPGPTPGLLADELLDLQQQVDFLLLLGQHEAAADLLAGRLAGGAGSAMPCLMLMELCQQRGEPEVFAELAKQFEQRFGTLAPSWSQSLARGRSLDTCPSVIAHLQVVWADPAAAMEMLQSLLAKGGGPGVPHFDLPAYRDLLTLYGVARDLFEAGLRGEGVDLMLPIDSQFGHE